MYENGNVNISTEPAHSGKGPKGKVLSQYRETTSREGREPPANS